MRLALLALPRLEVREPRLGDVQFACGLIITGGRVVLSLVLSYQKGNGINYDAILFYVKHLFECLNALPYILPFVLCHYVW